MTTNIPDCFEDGVLHIAGRPADQPDVAALRRADGYTIPLIAHDYPALTARLWNAAYRVFALPYVNCMAVANPARLPEIVAAFRADARYLGGGAGVGFKDAIVAHLDAMGQLAAAMDAVNVVVRTPDGRLCGWNTDGDGFAVSLERAFAERGRSLRDAAVVLIGAGGTANAIAFALAARGVRLRIVNRTVARAEALARSIERHLARQPEHAGTWVLARGEEDLADAVRDADAVVNASTKGSGATEGYSALAAVEFPSSPSRIEENHQRAIAVLQEMPAHALVADIVLGGGETATLRLARATGPPTLDGIPMVVEQAIEAFRIVHKADVAWHGISRERIAEIMWSAVRTSVPVPT